jgi:hypothetical protein
MVSQEVAQTSRTPGIATIAELAAKIKEVRDAAQRGGAGTPLTIQVHTPQASFIQRCGSAEEHRDHLGQLADAGVDSFVVRPPGDSLDRTIESLQRYATAFLKELRLGGAIGADQVPPVALPVHVRVDREKCSASISRKSVLPTRRSIWAISRATSFSVPARSCGRARNFSN